MTLEAAVAQAFMPVAEAIDAGRIPGAALGLVTRDGDRAVSCAGRAAVEPAETPLGRPTWFDLASLTKVLLTVPAVLHLVEEGALDLSDPIARPLPDLSQVDGNETLRSITISDLLTHRAGLPAWAPIYTWGGDSERLKAAVLQTAWTIGQPCYSDIGFILLGMAVERLRDKSLADLPLPDGLTADPEATDTAATERCPWRGRVLRGEVHDENAFSLGGLAGHAGLFGTVDGVLSAAHALMAGQWLTPAGLAALAAPRTATRALGWQRRHEEPVGAEPPWTGGSLCSPSTLGHTGFTGTGLWIDLDRGLAWTLLTNRVHPSRHAETGIQDLRRAVGNRVAAAWPADRPPPAQPGSD